MSYKPNEKYDYAVSQLEKLQHEVHQVDKETTHPKIVQYLIHVDRKFQKRKGIIQSEADLDNHQPNP